MVEWLAMMHVTPAEPTLNPTSLKLLFHNQKRSKRKVVAQTTKCPSMTEITILTLTNCEQKITSLEVLLWSTENQHFDIPAGETFIK